VSREVRTNRAATLAVGIIVTAGVVGGYAVHDRHHASAQPRVRSAAASTPAPVPASPAPRQPLLEGLSLTAPAPSAAGVAAELATATRSVTGGAQLAGEVVDASTGAELWARRPTAAEPPASTTKLITAAAALSTLGPDARLTTRTARVGDTVYLVGGGDPTLVRDASSYVSPAYPQPATLAALARRTAAALGADRRVRLRLDTSAWSGPSLARGWKPSYVTEGDITPPSALELDEGRIDPADEFATRSPTPAAQAGDAFVALLEHDGVRVVGATRLGVAPAGATSLGSVSSPPVAALVQRMLTVSDDDLAEALGRAVAAHQGLPTTFVGAGAAVISAAISLGVPTSGLTLQDTSGLSHLDRITPAALVAVLRLAASSAHPDLRSLVEGLPVAGLTGTLAERYLTAPSDAAAGVLRAKTGTLTGVNTLAGLVVDHSGRLLIFAFLASHDPLPGLTVPAVDGLASRLVHCGCAADDGG
jgi:serine-type D-Ala-D-Ala carboxypeptidase/endopeptidase (penicillin-binding protein 4)